MSEQSNPQRQANPQRQEAERLLAIFSGPELLEFLAGQLSVLKHQAQMLLGLCGLAITVTGFSGTQMIKAGRMSAVFLVVGIGLILLGALGSLHSLMQVRWVTEDLADDLTDTAYAVILRRNVQLRRLSIAGVLVACGLAAYLTSVALAAFAHHGG
jgi:hypothetical protein